MVQFKMRHFGLSLAMLACLAPGLACAEDWIARLDSVGPLRIGMTLDAVNKAIGQHFKKPRNQDDQACFYVSTSGKNAAELMFQHDTLMRIDISTPGMKTDTGISVGDAANKVMSAYDGRVAVAPNFYDKNEKYLTVASADKKFALRFETLAGKIDDFHVGFEKQVEDVEGCQSKSQ